MVTIAKAGQGTGGNAWGRQQSIARFWSHVDKSAGPEGCWLWKGAIDGGGYGRWGSPYWPGTNIAHRIAFLMAGGRIPKGWEIDHECHNRAGLDCPLFNGGSCSHRACVNPAHLAAVPLAENRRNKTRKPRPTHCPRAHPYDGANSYVNPKTGAIACRECVRQATERWLAKDGNRERQNALRNARRKRAS